MPDRTLKILCDAEVIYSADGVADRDFWLLASVAVAHEREHGGLGPDRWVWSPVGRSNARTLEEAAKAEHDTAWQSVRGSRTYTMVEGRRCPIK